MWLNAKMRLTFDQKIIRGTIIHIHFICQKVFFIMEVHQAINKNNMYVIKKYIANMYLFIVMTKTEIVNHSININIHTSYTKS